MLLGQHAIDQFHLARAVGTRMPGGRPLFAGLGLGDTVEAILARGGLRPSPTITLDAIAPVLLDIWQRNS
jgi:hypothetical protein